MNLTNGYRTEQEMGYYMCNVSEDCVLMHNETARIEAAWHNWNVFAKRHTFLIAGDDGFGMYNQESLDRLLL